VLLNQSGLFAVKIRALLNNISVNEFTCKKARNHSHRPDTCCFGYRVCEKARNHSHRPDTCCFGYRVCEKARNHSHRPDTCCFGYRVCENAGIMTSPLCGFLWILSFRYAKKQVKRSRHGTFVETLSVYERGISPDLTVVSSEPPLPPKQ
jgi:hypothetical protein